MSKGGIKQLIDDVPFANADDYIGIDYSQSREVGTDERVNLGEDAQADAVAGGESDDEFLWLRLISVWVRTYIR